MYRTYHIITNIILSVAILTLASVATLVLLCRVNNQTNMLNFFGFKTFVITSSSMEPSFLKGSFVITKKVAKDQIKIGDMVAYRATDNMLVFHRVVNINENGFTMKGDKLAYADGKIVTYDMVIGKAFFHTNLFVNMLNIIKAYSCLLLPLLVTIASVVFAVFGAKNIAKLSSATRRS